jgi:riboflavin biosynthesis pyrimidine reductase
MAVTREAAIAGRQALADLEAAGATLELFERPDIPALLARLAEREITLLLLEGGTLTSAGVLRSRRRRSRAAG